MNLVSGATGIVGAHVVFELLRQGRNVRAARQAGSDLSKITHLFELLEPGSSSLLEKVEWVQLDLRDLFSIEDALEGVSQAYHCAGFVSFAKKDRKKLMEVNEGGTRNMVNACLRTGSVELCHVSSVATLHNLDHQGLLDETVFWKKSGRESDYAISKYNAEREVWRGMEEGLRAVIVNPALILSAGFYGQSSARMLESAYKGNPFYTSGSAGYISAVDTARIMVRLMDEKCFGERFVLVESNLPYKTFLTKLNLAMGKKQPSVELGRYGLQLASVGESVFNLFSVDAKRVTGAVINSILNSQHYSGEKVKNRLNYKFEDLDKVLDFICQNYRNHREKSRTTD